jgi:hypothetical protein
MSQQRRPSDSPSATKPTPGAGSSVDPSAREPHNLAALASQVHEKLSEKEAAEAALRPPPVITRESAAPSPHARDPSRVRPGWRGLSQVAPGILKWGLVIAVALAVIGTQLPKLLPHSQEFIREELAILLYHTRAEVELHRDKYGHIDNYRPRTSVQSPKIGTVYLHYQRLDKDHYRLVAVSDHGETMAVTTEGLAFPVAHGSH